MKTLSFVNCFAFVSIITKVVFGVSVDANVSRGLAIPSACNPTKKKQCIRVKNRKNGKKCAWRRIDGKKQCVLRASCSGIRTKAVCNKKKKKRACSWKKGTAHGSTDGSGECVSKEKKPQTPTTAPTTGSPTTSSPTTASPTTASHSSTDVSTGGS